MNTIHQKMWIIEQFNKTTTDQNNDRHTVASVYVVQTVNPQN